MIGARMDAQACANATARAEAAEGQRDQARALLRASCADTPGDLMFKTQMTYDELLNRVITDGIAEIREVYAAPQDHHKRDGALEGFEACRGKSPVDLVMLWSDAEKRAKQSMPDHRGTSDGDAKDYWRQRYKALQIEWVCNVISVGLVNGGHPPLLTHQPTARAAFKYAMIVGVCGGQEARS